MVKYEDVIKAALAGEYFTSSESGPGTRTLRYYHIPENTISFKVVLDSTYYTVYNDQDELIAKGSSIMEFLEFLRTRNALL